MANTLPDIRKELGNPSAFGTSRSHPKTPNNVGRWENFKLNAENFDFPSISIDDMNLPKTANMKFSTEKDVHKIIGIHLDNFNGILKEQGLKYLFQSNLPVSQHPFLEFLISGFQSFIIY